MGAPGSNVNWPELHVYCNFTTPAAESTDAFPYQAMNVTLTTQITNSFAVTALAVTAIPRFIPAGRYVTVMRGRNLCSFQLSADALAGVTSLSVVSTVPDTTYPVGSTVDIWAEITQFCRRLGDGNLMHIERGRNYERGQTDSAILNLTLDNSTGVFDAQNTNSPFFPNVRQVRKVYITAKWQGTTYSLFYGHIDDWPRVWKSAGYWGEVTATGRGIFAALSTIILDSPWVAKTQQLGAKAIYRLNDPSNSVTAANWSSFQQLYANVKYLPTTTKDSSFSFGSNPGIGNLAGDPTNSLTLTPVLVAPANPGAGFYLELANDNDASQNLYFNDTGGQSLEFWFQTTAVLQNVFMMLWQQQNSAMTFDQIRIYLAAIGSPTVTGMSVWVDVNGQIISVSDQRATANYADGNWHQVVFTFGTDGKTIKLYIDGVTLGGVTAIGAIAPWDSVASAQNLGGDTDAFGTKAFNGNFKNVAYYDFVLTQAQVTAQFLAGQGYVGDDTGARIKRILDFAPYPYQQLDVGNSNLGRMSIEGTNVVQAIQDANDTEQGTLVETTDGYVKFKNRRSRNPTNITLAGFNDSDDFHPHYEDDLNVTQDSAQIYTDIKVARDLGITITAVDTAAELEYFPRTLSMTSRNSTDDDAIYLAQYLLGQYKVGRDRIPTLTIVWSSQPTWWVYAFQIDIGTPVAVVRTNPQSQQFSEVFYVEKITHDVATPLKWKTTYMLSSSSLWWETFILDDNNYGVLDFSNLGY